MKSKLLALALILMTATAAFAQIGPQRDSQSAVSGATLTFQNPRGSSAQSFEYVISGSPATASIILQGCMVGGTCDTLETSTSTTNTNRGYNAIYDYFTVAPTFSGGSSPALRVNILFGFAGTPRGTTAGINLLTQSLKVAPVTVDPCASPSVAKSTAAIAFSSATTTAMVTAVASKVVYVCSVTFTMSSGTTPTIKFVTGTGGACGTGQVALTGVMALSPTIGTAYTFGGAGHTSFAGAVSGDACYTTAGTTPTGNGFVTYVQQ